MPGSKAEKQMKKVQEMLGISDDRAEEIFKEEPDRKQKKKKELEEKKQRREVDAGDTVNQEPSKSYGDLLSGTVKEVKEHVKEKEGNNEELDYRAMVDEEKKNKNRSTLLKYLERRL